jgi:hypothetical protein
MNTQQLPHHLAPLEGPGHVHLPPHFRNGRSNGQFSLLVVGEGVYGLLGEPPETREELRAILLRRSPSDIPLLDEVLATASEDFSVKHVLRILAALKSRDYYERILANSTSGNHEPSGTAVILPLPRHLEDEVYEASPDRIFILRGHPLPHHLAHLDPKYIPTKPRDIRDLFAHVARLKFEACYISNGSVATREEIVALLEVFEDTEIRPKLLIHCMPHQPPHETFERIGDGWEVSEI